MSEDKDIKKEENSEAADKTENIDNGKNNKSENAGDADNSKKTNDKEIEKAEKAKDKPAVNDLGMEELPEDIKKKLEKKKGEKDQKSRKIRKKKKKAPRKVPTGKAYIKATYNNTIVTLTDMQGNVLSWASAGMAGFKGAKKSTPYAAQIISRIAVGKAREEFGLSEVCVYVKGVGTGRESAIRSLNNNGLIVTFIKDVTPVPHNGCRPKKPRRV
jgi:small subunit ribosomal protein S11